MINCTKLARQELRIDEAFEKAAVIVFSRAILQQLGLLFLL